MKKENKIYPVGLKGNQINERMKELMGIAPINESIKNFVIELTKVGPDGKAYAIVRENHEYYIKITDKKAGLVAEDFKYIGGLMNKKSESYPSYAKAIKQLNLKFRSLAEAYNFEGEINITLDDNLLSEAGIAGFSNYGGNGFSGEGNLTGNSSLPMTEEEAIANDIDSEDDELTEEEKAIDAMTEDEGGERAPEGSDEPNEGGEADGTPEPITEHKLSILRALESMDAIIDGLTEGSVKKKVYKIK